MNVAIQDIEGAEPLRLLSGEQSIQKPVQAVALRMDRIPDDVADSPVVSAVLDHAVSKDLRDVTLLATQSGSYCHDRVDG